MIKLQEHKTEFQSLMTDRQKLQQHKTCNNCTHNPGQNHSQKTPSSSFLLYDDRVESVKNV